VAAKDYNLEQPMDKLLDIAVKKFGEVEFKTVSVGESSLKILQIKNMQGYIDKLMDQTRSGKKVVLPLWAKVWPSSIVMGVSLGRFPFADGSHILEIGAGGSLNGLALAMRGFDVTITDTDQDALLFSRINALKNGLEDSVTVRKTDLSDGLGMRFDYIIGCEMLYDEAQFEQLVGFVQENLAEAPTAEVLLALDLKREARGFFVKANESFNMMKTTAGFSDKETGDDKTVNLFRLRRK